MPTASRRRTQSSRTSSRQGQGRQRTQRPGSTSARERISPRGDTRFVRRSSRGRIEESDAGRSLRGDRPRRAKRTVRAGQGDRGDQRRR